MIAARQPRIIRLLPHLRTLTAVAAVLLLVSFTPDLLARTGALGAGGSPAAAPAAAPARDAASVQTANQPTAAAKAAESRQSHRADQAGRRRADEARRRAGRGGS